MWGLVDLFALTRSAPPLFVVLLLSGLAPGAMAQSGDVSSAKEAFKAGQELLKMQRFGEAVVEFNKAYEITKDGLVLGQVAIAYEQAGDYEGALRAITAYRRALPPRDRRSVDPLIRKYKKMIARGRSKKLVLPSAASVAPDPEEQAPASGLGAAGVAGAAGAATAVEAEPPSGGEELLSGEPRRRKRLWTWVAAGTAAALGVSALVVGLSAQSKFNELEDRCGEGTGGVCDPGDVDSVNSRAVATDVLWGTALVAGATAAVLYFLEGRRSGGSDREEAPALPEEEELEDPSDEEVDDELVHRFQVAPIVSGNTFGVGAVIRY